MKYVRIEGNVAYVELTKGFEAIIDVADVSLVCAHSWHVVPNKMGGQYARSGKVGYMHRFITNAPKNEEPDHINHNTLDNRRSNLRLVTHQQNNEHRNGAYRGNKTGVRGLTVIKRTYKGKERFYYWARVWSNYRVVAAKAFPLTEEGKEAAAEWVAEQRGRLMTHAD